MGERLTLDTMLARDLLEQRSQREATDAILTLAREGRCELAVTARIREDIPDDPLASRIDELELLAIEETGSITRADYWVVGRDQVASDDFAAFEQEIKERSSRGEKLPDWRDLDHLHAHFLQKLRRLPDARRVHPRARGGTRRTVRHRGDAARRVPQVAKP